MRRHFTFRSAFLVVTHGILLLAAANVHARTEIHPYASAQVYYNSNVFKFADDEESMQLNHTRKRDDRVQSGTLGLTSHAAYRQHQATLRASLSRNDYDYFDFLDNTSRDINADVAGDFGSDWSYKINLQQATQLIDYTELSTNFTLRNELKRNGYGIGIRYRLMPNVNWHVDLQGSNQRYSHPAYYYSNVDTYRAEMGVSYQRSDAAQIRVFLQAVSDDFPDRNITANSVLDDSQLSFLGGTDVNLALSGNFTIASRLGIKARRHYDATARDYVGIIYKLENRWQVSGKNRITLLLNRDAAPVELIQANYAIVDEFGLRSSWLLRHNTDIALSATQRWYDYYNRDDVTRRDRTLNVFASVVYTPYKYFNFGIDAGQEVRRSDVESYGFAVNTLRFSLQLTL